MKIEKIFEVIGCDEVQKVTLATFVLKGEAEYWWTATKDVLVVEEDGPETWDIFLEAFQGNYFFESVQDKKEIEFMELIKGS